MTGLDTIILPKVLAQIDHFQLVTSLEHTRFGVASRETGFGRKRHPIEIRRQLPSTVGLDGDTLACLVSQCCHKTLIDKERRLTSCQHDQWCDGILIYLIHNLLQRHHRPFLMFGIAKSATQVTATEAHKDGWRPRMVAFTLKRMEYFVYSKHCGASSLM